LRELKFHSHFFSSAPEPSPVNLSETCSSYSFFIELTEDVLQITLEVIFINNFDLFKWKLRALILKNLKHFNILFGCDSFQSADILTGLEIDATTTLT
jgi:hypothetical protein